MVWRVSGSRTPDPGLWIPDPGLRIADFLQKTYEDQRFSLPGAPKHIFPTQSPKSQTLFSRIQRHANTYTYGWAVDGRTSGQLDRWLVGRVDVWTVGQLDVWASVWLDDWTFGQVDG